MARLQCICGVSAACLRHHVRSTLAARSFAAHLQHIRSEMYAEGAYESGVTAQRVCDVFAARLQRSFAADLQHI
eukprot:8566924-Lingulodinium_polyedra.AAC.1